MKDSMNEFTVFDPVDFLKTAEDIQYYLEAAAQDEDPKTFLRALRTAVDTLERKVSDARWPLPKYRDMLFLY